ncbi:uncharacterized protein LOC105686914 [Athalia rosae]|uniref:uncharacterized protein LOC105686914 n=1 Tax=Athalia rosae TaxID=37344 RepID=UPI0006255D7A|nr:uncharacterized protein LOC105686914 [Athalia rosae]
MSGSRLIYAFGLAILLSQISVILSGGSVPVVFIGSENQKLGDHVSALGVLQKEEFDSVVEAKVGVSRKPIVVFSRDNLCVEELRQQKYGKDDFNTIYYFPAVDSPLSTLSNLKSYNVSTDDKPESIDDGQVYIVTVANLSTIPELYKSFKALNSEVHVVVTGESCSYSRSERSKRAVTVRAEPELIVQVDKILLYSSQGIYVKFPESETSYFLGTPKNTSAEGNATHSYRLDMAFTANGTNIDVNLQLQFSVLSAGYWYLESVGFEGNSTTVRLTPAKPIYFPFEFSYHCSLNNIFSSNTTSVNFTDLQVQIFSSTNNDTLKFSDGYDCVGFTTIPIWSGIFVTAIMALIMIWGLLMILDIRTMDRFDDPKGKTITIATSE